MNNLTLRMFQAIHRGEMAGHEQTNTGNNTWLSSTFAPLLTLATWMGRGEVESAEAAGKSGADETGAFQNS